ncbi:MAG: transporter substrate-binding domain-containing protein [Gammaproteobacteria bacterium]|nr:transporter substrate-binding domain-containing protein [Gammaproteobacteria bacterium]
MRRRFLKLIVGLSALLPLTGVIAASNDQTPVLSRISDSGTLRVGMSAGQPPFNVTNRDGKIIGLDVDLADLLATAIGVKLEIVAMPFGDLLMALEGGKIDLVISGMTATLQRNMRAAFVGPYHISGKSILARSETIAALQSEGLNKGSLKIAALKGSTSEDFVKLRAPNAKLTATDTYDTAIDMLLSGEADLFVADASIVMLSQLRWPDAGLVSSSKPLTIEPIGVAVPAGDPLFLNLVQNYMNALKASGALEQLEKKWFKSGAWLMQLP